MFVEIKKIVSKSDLKRFVNFYTNLYLKCKYAPLPLHSDELSTLSEKKNPAYKHCKIQYWMAFRDGLPVGRIAAIINEIECEKLDLPIGRFGWFDFIDDTEVSHALIRTAIDWLKEHKIYRVHGPFGFTDLDRQGMLIEGFDKMGTFATLYNYPYYIEHMESFGFSKGIDWIEYEIDVENLSVDRINIIAGYAADKYKYRMVALTSRKELKKYIYSVFDLLNKGFANLYGYTKLTKGQVEHYAKMFINLVKLDFISLVVDRNDVLIGFGIAMPSFTEASRKAKGRLLPLGWYFFFQALKKNHTLDLLLVAVDPDYQNKGVDALMISHTAKKASEFGILRAETNIELEDNSKVQNMWRFFEPNQHKRRRCYIKEF